MAPPREAFRLIFSSSAGCGKAANLLRELDRRTTRLRPARDDEHAITLIVELFRTDFGVRGQLTVRKLDGDLTAREVPGRDCQEVESALALIVALMVDPLATNAKPLPARSEVATGFSARPGTESHSSYWVEQRASLRSAIAPRAAWGEGLGLMFMREQSPLRWSVGLSATVARSSSSSLAGSAQFEWAAAELAVCPVGWQPSSGWDVRACGTAQAGRLRAAGFATSNPAENRLFWWALGGSLQARRQLIGPLWVGLEAALEFPLSRQSFYFEPGPIVHRVPAVGASGGLGAGLRFF